MLPKISIIVPVYNAEKFLDRCMISIYAQTFTDYEVILVNDGSTDNSLRICRGYAAHDSRVKVVSKENGGAGSARNDGIAVARGEYLAFPDVDDWFAPTMYENLYHGAMDGDFDMVLSGVNYYKQTKAGPGYFRTENIPSIQLNNQEECRRHIMDFFPTTTIFDVPWNKLYKRSVVVDNNIRFSDLRRCQDAMFNIDFFNKVHSVRSLDMAFYNYMLNTSEDVQRKFPQNYIDICISYYTHLINILKSWGVYSGEIRSHYDTSFAISIFATACMYDNPRWNLDSPQRIAYIDNIMRRPEVREFLADAIVRNDATERYTILKNTNPQALIKYKKKEDFKDALRSSKLLMLPYRFMKNLINKLRQ